MIRPLLVMPDARLHQVCRPVADDEDVFELMRDLVDTARSLTEMDGKRMTCAGLAAPQLGVLLRVVVVMVPGATTVLVNPVITRKIGKVVRSREGCWSEPGVTVDVMRFKEVVVRHRGGAAHFRGTWSYAAQHELDHLEGKLLSDRLPQTKAAKA